MAEVRCYICHVAMKQNLVDQSWRCPLCFRVRAGSLSALGIVQPEPPRPPRPPKVERTPSGHIPHKHLPYRITTCSIPIEMELWVRSDVLRLGITRSEWFRRLITRAQKEPL